MDCIIANNVLPHTPELIDFIKGLSLLIDSDGVIVIQFSAYLVPLIKNVQFDHIYHEHFSYFSLHTMRKILEKFKLEIFDVDELSVHGGSLRLYIKKVGKNQKVIHSKNLDKILKNEEKFGITRKKTYEKFQSQILEKKSTYGNFLLLQKNLVKKLLVMVLLLKETQF